MSQQAKVKRLLKTDVSGLVRDTSTNALLYSDKDALEAYKRRKNSVKAVYTLEKKVDDLIARVKALEAKLGK